MGYGASPAESSGSPEQILLGGSRCCRSFRRSGEAEPCEAGVRGQPLALRVRKRSQVLRDARGSHSSPSLRSTQEWGGYRPPGAHLCSQTRMALTPRHLAPGQGQAGPGSEWAAGSGATLFLRHQGLILPRARSAPLAITVAQPNPSIPHIPEKPAHVIPESENQEERGCEHRGPQPPGGVRLERPELQILPWTSRARRSGQVCAAVARDARGTSLIVTLAAGLSSDVERKSVVVPSAATGFPAPGAAESQAHLR
uniref:Uncharacterized protein n=1 Tax=Rangifer tarandus platyrhynchus TaxID=3082113 RepID=A0ACB0F889_RANTA|nr:unnamed protein product [Rangifer tarandus platyrhynchus]